MLKGKMPLLIALALGVLAMVISFSAIESAKSDVRKGWDLIQVMVAERDIPAGSEITFENMSKRGFPSKFVTPSNIKFEERILKQLEGQRVVVDVKTGDPLLWNQFETTKGFEKISTVVQKKFRAISINVSEKNGVAGWVRPNDHVDVLGTFRDPATNDMMTVTLLQDVIVLATGKLTGSANLQLIDESKRGYANVSVMLTPGEAEIITLAQEMGTLTLALRNPEDLDHNEERERTTLQTLLSGERVKQLQRARFNSIQVIGRGGRGASSEHGQK